MRFALGTKHTYVFAQGSVSWPMAKELEGIADSSKEYFAYFDPEDASTYVTAYHELDKFIELEGPFDGVFAFSQGAGLAITYMARMRIDQPEGFRAFKCAILFSPTGVGDPFEWLSSGEMRRLKSLPGSVKVNTPTAMVWGREDAYFDPEGMDTSFGLFDQEVAWNYVHSGVHEVPNPLLEGSIQMTKQLAVRAMTIAGICNA